MSFYAVIKKNALAALKGRWPGAVGVAAFIAGVGVFLTVVENTLLQALLPSNAGVGMGLALDYADFVRRFFVHSPVEPAIAGGFSLIALFLFTPLSLGLTRWFYLLIGGERPTFYDLFHFFERGRRYARAVGYTIQIGVRAGFWGILFFCLPSGLTIACVRLLRIEELGRQFRSAASIGVLFALCLFLLAGILYAIFLGRYSLTVYLLCESDMTTLNQAFRRSIRYTKGYLGTKFGFTLSYIGWYVLSALMLFLPLLWVTPYHMAGETVLARYLAEKNREPDMEGTKEFGGTGQGDSASR